MFQSDQKLNLIHRHALGLSQAAPTTQGMTTSQAKPWLSCVQTKVTRISIFRVFPDSRVLTTHRNGACCPLLLCGCVYWMRLSDRLEYYSVSYYVRERMPASGLSQLPFLNRDLLGHYSVYNPYMSPQAPGDTLDLFTIWRAQTNHTQPTVNDGEKNGTQQSYNTTIL